MLDMVMPCRLLCQEHNARMPTAVVGKHRNKSGPAEKLLCCVLCALVCIACRQDGQLPLHGTGR
jgi:hypothetical protein